MNALPQTNGANITLIPKMETTYEPKDFRPISLIHSFAKLVAKSCPSDSANISTTWYPSPKALSSRRGVSKITSYM
jgi:hypothetical protein